MSLFNQENQFGAELDRAMDLFSVGAGVLFEMQRDGNREGSIRYKEWAASLRELGNLDPSLTTNENLKWLWESLRTTPNLVDWFGKLPAAGLPWTNKKHQFDVFQPGEWFVIGMKGREINDLLQGTNRSAQDERVSVQTNETLRMRPGKGERLECCDCKSEVTIRVTEVFSLDREADLMLIEKDRISISPGIIKVQVNSLNQAYTVSSRRLEPERRSHGGRTYDHVVHVSQRKRTRLEDVRKQVESGEWLLKKTESTKKNGQSEQ
ncbi:hypothetical protein N9Z38_00465 [Mariniblastus sp.]|nr:hypothetical protein [Mariniblastus sp.]